MRLVEKYFRTHLAPDVRSPADCPETVAPFDETRDNHHRNQANVVIGTVTYSASDPRRYALYLFSAILGGSAMNSRLNRVLRERRGLVYTVESSVSLYSMPARGRSISDRPLRMSRSAHGLYAHEVEAIAAGPDVRPRSSQQARRQLCGQLLVKGDNCESCAMALAKSLMRHGEVVLDNGHTARQIMSLTPDDLRPTRGPRHGGCPASRLMPYKAASTVPFKLFFNPHEDSQY